MIRKIVTVLEETHGESGRDVLPPTRKAAAIAVVRNPYAGRWEENLEVLIDLGERLGWQLGRRAVALLGIEPGQAQSYGKAAIVGEDGELEHAAAILHPKLGAPLARRRGEGRRPGAVGQEARRHGHGDRRAAGPQGRRLCAQPFRRHGDPRRRRAPAR